MANNDIMQTALDLMNATTSQGQSTVQSIEVEPAATATFDLKKINIAPAVNLNEGTQVDGVGKTYIK